MKEVKVLKITPDALFALFAIGNHAYRIKESPIPADAKVVGGRFRNGAIDIAIESELFEKMTDTNLPPVIAEALTLKTYEKC